MLRFKVVIAEGEGKGTNLWKDGRTYSRKSSAKRVADKFNNMPSSFTPPYPLLEVVPVEVDTTAERLAEAEEVLKECANGVSFASKTAQEYCIKYKLI